MLSLDEIRNVIDGLQKNDFRVTFSRSELSHYNDLSGSGREYKFRIEPISADVSGIIDKMASESPKYKNIFGNIPKSRTKLQMVLTGKIFQELPASQRADLEAAAIKIFQRAHIPLVEELEAKLKANFPQYDFITTMVDMLFSGKCPAIYDLYVFDKNQQPKNIPNKEVLIPKEELIEPIQQEKELDFKIQPKQLNYQEKFIDSKSNYSDLLKIAESASMIITDKSLENKITDLDIIVNKYIDMKIASLANNDESTYMVNDDYYRSSKSPVFYEMYTIKDCSIRSRSMMSQLKNNETFTVKSKKLGSKPAKEVRNLLQKEEMNDEIIIYCKINPRKNPFHGRQSSHTGKFDLFIWLANKQ